MVGREELLNSLFDLGFIDMKIADFAPFLRIHPEVIGGLFGTGILDRFKAFEVKGQNGIVCWDKVNDLTAQCGACILF